MKRILILLTVLLIIVSCGKGKNDSKSGEGKVNQKQQINEVQKYNSYIKIYNELLNFEKSINYYIEDAGNQEQVQKSENGVTISFADLSYLVETIKKAEVMKPKMDELDKTAKDLLPVMEEFAPLVAEMKTYYQGKDYTSDNYKKAQEFHTKFLASLKKYDETVKQFRAAMDKKVAEQREKDMNMLKKEGRVITYNRLVILNVAEEILAEIKKQNLNGGNLISGDVSKFKPLQEKLINAVSEFQTSVNDGKQLEKEGYKSHSISGFVGEATDFKAAVATFIKKIENKEKIDNNILQNSFFLENENGSPENIIKSFNELVNEYNRMN